MLIYEKIKSDLVVAIKSKDEKTKSLLRVLISDIQRDPNKDYSDVKVIKVIQHTIAALSDPHVMAKDASNSIPCMEFLERSYLPTKITHDDIKKFVDTIDFSQLKNKMQAIGLVTKHFPAGSVDGAVVKDIVTKHNV